MAAAAATAHTPTERNAMDHFAWWKQVEQKADAWEEEEGADAADVMQFSSTAIPLLEECAARLCSCVASCSLSPSQLVRAVSCTTRVAERASQLTAASLAAAPSLSAAASFSPSTSVATPPAVPDSSEKDEEREEEDEEQPRKRRRGEQVAAAASSTPTTTSVRLLPIVSQLLAYSLLRLDNATEGVSSAAKASAAELSAAWMELASSVTQLLSLVCLDPSIPSLALSPAHDALLQLLCRLLDLPAPVRGTAEENMEDDQDEIEIHRLAATQHALAAVQHLSMLSEHRAKLLRYRTHAPPSAAPTTASSSASSSTATTAARPRASLILSRCFALAFDSHPRVKIQATHVSYLLLQQSNIADVQLAVDTLRAHAPRITAAWSSASPPRPSSPLFDENPDDASQAEFEKRCMRAIVAASNGSVPLELKSSAAHPTSPFSALFDPATWRRFVAHHWEQRPLLLRANSSSPFAAASASTPQGFGSHSLPTLFAHGISVPLAEKHCRSLAQFLAQSWFRGEGGRNVHKGLRNRHDCTLIRCEPPAAAAAAAGADAAELHPQLSARPVLYGDEGSILSWDEVPSALTAGYTLTMRGLADRDPSVASLSHELSQALGGGLLGVSANMYQTPVNNQGFEIHYDDHCVFVLQIEGTKTWNIWNEVRRLPPLDEPRFTPTALAAGSPTEVVLHPGDVLYIPRGVAHSAATSATSFSASSAIAAAAVPSMHVSFGIEVDTAATVQGFFHLVAAQIIRADELQLFHRTLAAFAMRLQAIESQQSLSVAGSRSLDLATASPMTTRPLDSSCLRQLCPILLLPVGGSSTDDASSPLASGSLTPCQQQLIAMVDFVFTHDLFGEASLPGASQAAVVNESLCWLDAFSPQEGDKATQRPLALPPAADGSAAAAAGVRPASDPASSSSPLRSSATRWRSLFLRALTQTPSTIFSSYRRALQPAAVSRHQRHEFLSRVSTKITDINIQDR